MLWGSGWCSDGIPIEPCGVARPANRRQGHQAPELECRDGGDADLANADLPNFFLYCSVRVAISVNNISAADSAAAGIERLTAAGEGREIFIPAPVCLSPAAPIPPPLNANAG
jgi:hypothetical protein